MDKGTLVSPARLTPDIFPFISICPDPPLKNWDEAFGNYNMDSSEAAWQSIVLKRNLNTSDGIRKLYKELSYVEEEIIADVSVVYKDLFQPLTIPMRQEDPVSQYIGEDKLENSVSSPVVLNHCL